MLLPFAEALTQSFDASRGGPPLAARAALTPFFPEYWGRLRPCALPTSRRCWARSVELAEQTLYIGALPVLLAIAGLSVAGRVAPSSSSLRSQPPLC